MLRQGRGVSSVGSGNVGFRRGVRCQLALLLVLLLPPEGPAAGIVCKWEEADSLKRVGH